MHIEEIIQKIVPADRGCMKLAQTRFDNLIKPVGSLAKLEEMTSRYCGIKGIYEKEDLDYPKRDLLVWCGIEELLRPKKLCTPKWPVNVLAAETGAKAVALLVTSEEEADALEEGAAWCRSWYTRRDWSFWASAAFPILIMRWYAPLWPALCCRLQL